jgi:hypothetical protein
VHGATFLSNSAFGGSTGNVGGAIHASVYALGIRLSGAVVRGNEARGYEPQGGAINAEADIHVENATMSANRVVASGGIGRGGALHIASSVATLVGCRLHHNVAESLRGALLAFGGSVNAEADATLRLSDSRVWLNTMGGVGSVQGDAQGGYNTGMNIQGIGVFERCDFADTGEGGDAIVLEKPPQYWFDPSKRLIIRDCSFRSSSPGKALLPCWLDVLIRGSTFLNLPIEPCSDTRFAKVEPGTLGVVNSTFEPPLDASVATVQPPDCSIIAAGERVCDERAHCEALPSGGVRCSCVGDGLRYKVGVPEDGRRCEQDPRLRATLSSASLALTVRKLGPYNDSRSENVTLTATAEGEDALSTVFRVNVTRIDAMSHNASASNDSVPIDQPSLSAFGLHLDWETPPTLQRQAKLNGNAYKYRDTVQHGFRARLGALVEASAQRTATRSRSKSRMLRRRARGSRPPWCGSMGRSSRSHRAAGRAHRSIRPRRRCRTQRRSRCASRRSIATACR